MSLTRRVGRVALGVACVAACSSEPAPTRAPTPWVVSFDASPPSMAPCADAAPPARIDRTVRVAVSRGPGVPASAVQRLASELAGFYAPYGLRFEAVGAVASVPDEAVLAGAASELPREAEPSQAARALASDAVLGPLRAFMRAHAVPARDRVHVVVLRRVARPDSVVRRHLGDLRGLTLSPALRGAVDGGAGPELAEWLDLPRAFTPTVFVSLEDLRGAPGRELTLAHEVGHALGLEHRSAPDDLMAVVPPRCLPGLDAAQVARLREGADAL